MEDVTTLKDSLGAIMQKSSNFNQARLIVERSKYCADVLGFGANADSYISSLNEEQLASLDSDIRKAKEEQRKIQEKEEEERQHEALIRKTRDSFPLRYRNASLSDFSDKIAESGREIAKGHHSAILLGSNGTGKTHFAYAVCFETIVNNKRDATVIRAFDFMQGIKRCYSNNEPTGNYLDSFKQDVLVIDELDKIKDSEHDLTYLTYLIDKRYENMKSTVLILHAMNASEVVSIIGQSSFSRLTGYDGMILSMTGADRRKTAPLQPTQPKAEEPKTEKTENESSFDAFDGYEYGDIPF